MGGSRPKLAAVTARPPSPRSEIDAALDKLGSGPLERPTRQAMEAVRLAEQETRLAKKKGVSEVSEVTNIATLDSIGDDEPSGVESLTGRSERVTAIRDLYVSSAEAALELAEDLPPPSIDPGLQAGLPIVGSRPRLASESDPPEGEQLVALSSIVPQVLVSAAEISRLPMDPRAAFLLGHVDGIQSMEEILDSCAMPEPEALDLLEKLRAMGVITMG